MAPAARTSGLAGGIAAHTELNRVPGYGNDARPVLMGAGERDGDIVGHQQATGSNDGAKDFFFVGDTAGKSRDNAASNSILSAERLSATQAVAKAKVVTA